MKSITKSFHFFSIQANSRFHFSFYINDHFIGLLKQLLETDERSVAMMMIRLENRSILFF